MESSIVDVDLGLPGDKFEFEDVTAIFTAAASAMDEDEVILMDNFTLQDAMSAFEIGEPRLDTGVLLDGEHAPPGAFDPLTPLLPEELCWIIDRAYAYEMQWHAGNPLSHTVYTLQYMHHLPRFDPEFVLAGLMWRGGAERPVELVTVVLRAAVLGLLKCCDLSWRELSKGGVQDGEDWQGDKCEVSLLEGIQVHHVISKLAGAMNWLLTSTNFPVHLLEALHTRLALRKTLLEIMDLDLHKSLAQFQHLVHLARVQLDTIRAYSVSLPAESPAHAAFDPYLARRLNTFVPIRIVPIPPIDETWDALEGVLDGWKELSMLSKTPSLLTWELVANLRVWLPSSPPRTPYIRSATQSFFYDGILVLHQFSFAWLVDQFFFETCGISYEHVYHSVKTRWAGRGAPPLQHIERTLHKLLTNHIRGLWYNPPRRRRFLVKSLLSWHMLFHDLSSTVAQLAPLERLGPDFMAYIPTPALLWRLAAMREIVFSGFQLELYAAWEKPFAYWYAVAVMEAHLAALDGFLPVLSPGSRAYTEMRFQHDLLTALQALSTAVFAASLRLAPQPWHQERPHPNLLRRYKWAFRAEYDAVHTPPQAHPEPERFAPACSQMLNDPFFSPRDSVVLARTVLLRLVAARGVGGSAAHWAPERLQGLLSACDGLAGLPRDMAPLREGAVGVLVWDPHVHPWFPRLDV